MRLFSPSIDLTSWQESILFVATGYIWDIGFRIGHHLRYLSNLSLTCFLPTETCLLKCCQDDLVSALNRLWGNVSDNYWIPICEGVPTLLPDKVTFRESYTHFREFSCGCNGPSYLAARGMFGQGWLALVLSTSNLIFFISLWYSLCFS